MALESAEYEHILQEKPHIDFKHIMGKGERPYFKENVENIFHWLRYELLDRKFSNAFLQGGWKRNRKASD